MPQTNQAFKVAAGPANDMALLVQRARMAGMVVFDYVERYPEAMAELQAWLADGRLKSHEDIVVGLENFPDALLRLFSGANHGKLILALGEPA